MTQEHAERPSMMRHFVVGSAALMAMLLYLDRFCVSVAQPYIEQDLGLSTLQMGLFFSAFFLTYALCQVPSGWLTDRFGSRVMLVVYVLTWSFFTAMMGLSYGFIMLILMRAAYGVGQSGAYPTSASIISKWVPFSNRGTASSIVAVGGRVGGAIAPILTAFLIVLFVPVSRSSLFEADELRKADKLCYTVAPLPEGKADDAPSDGKQADTRERPPSAEHIWGLLSTESQSAIEEIAEKYRPVADQIAELEEEAASLKRQRRFIAARDKAEAADVLRIKLSDAQKTRVAAALNEIVRSREFCSQDQKTFERVFDGVVLKSAAEDLRERIAAGETLTDDEMQRLNRLVLETLYPDALGNVYVAGWRPVMITYGAFGLIVAALLWVTLRNRPEEHPRCNAAELELIAAGRPENAASPHGKTGGIPWGPLLRSRSMWLNSIAQVGTNIGWVFIVTWFPNYLLKAHNVTDPITRGWMASIPLFVGWFGMLGGGRLTDYCAGRFGVKWGRRIPWGGSRFIAIAAFLACPYLGSPWAVTAAMSLVAFSTDLGTASAWAFTQDVGGKYVGSVLGWGNMWGNLGATVSPILLAWVFSDFGFNVMFQVCAAAFVLAGFCVLGIDATISLDPDAERDGTVE